MTITTLDCGCVITYDMHSHNIISIKFCSGHADKFQNELKNIYDDLVRFNADFERNII
jgi:hypothetical protein